MRIIAGQAKRMTITAPKGQNTRPTSDMARESLFNIIAPYVRDARVLDIFCGSGAVGIEALSRGAATATFIDQSKFAIQATRHNLAHTKLAPHATVIQSTIDKALPKLAGQQFDIIFMDPPYDSPLIFATLQYVHSVNILAQSGIIIAETDVDMTPPLPPGFIVNRIKSYGRGSFLFIDYAQIDEGEGK